jgi:hypothetical protein
MLNNDKAVSWIRTAVPIIIGVVFSWAVRHGLPVGGIDDGSAATYVTPLAIAAYYSVVRTLEAKWPQLGWLLGVAKQPQYVPGPAPAPAAGQDAVAVVEPPPAPGAP